MNDKNKDSEYFVTMTHNPSNSNQDISSTSGVEALIGRAARAGKGAPPVENWHPEFCGELDIEIKQDGTWFYLGTPIGRIALVQLFSSVLRKDEDGQTFLVTPVEKIKIRVEDAHFIAVEVDIAGEGDNQILTFRTNVGDVVEAGHDHMLRFAHEDETQGVKPYLTIRGRLEALVGRSVMYELVNAGEELEIDGVMMFAIRSKGMIFPIMRADELARLSSE